MLTLLAFDLSGGATLQLQFLLISLEVIGAVFTGYLLNFLTNKVKELTSQNRVLYDRFLEHQDKVYKQFLEKNKRYNDLAAAVAMGVNFDKPIIDGPM